MLISFCAAILISCARYFVQAIVPPIAFCGTFIEVVWRLQRRAAGLVPHAVAMLITVAVEIAALAIVVFLSLTSIQNIFESLIEPWMASFGSFLWGIPGAFIGVPVLIAALTICQRYPRHPLGRESAVRPRLRPHLNTAF